MEGFKGKLPFEYLRFFNFFTLEIINALIIYQYYINMVEGIKILHVCQVFFTILNNLLIFSIIESNSQVLLSTSIRTTRC